MSAYELALIYGAIAIVLISLRNSRGVAWVFMITADLIASTAYWKAGYPYGEVFTAACDATICLGIYFAGKFRWEMWLYRLYLASLGWSLVYLAVRAITLDLVSQDTYASGLEFINWIAFLSIGGISASQLAGRRDVLGLFGNWRRRFPAFIHPILREDGADQGSRETRSTFK